MSVPISMPGIRVRSGNGAAAWRASAIPSVESWSVRATMRTPCWYASCTSSAGERTPSEAVLCRWKSALQPIPSVDAIDPVDAAGAPRPLVELDQHRVELNRRAALRHRQLGGQRGQEALEHRVDLVPDDRFARPYH